ERFREVVAHRLERDSGPAARHAAPRDGVLRDPRGGVDGDGEADALARRQDRGVDTDDLAQRVEQRAARVARVDGGVRLDEVLVRDDPNLGPPRRAHDAHGDGLLEPEGAPDRDGPLADLDAVGVPELRRDDALVGGDPDDGEVGRVVCAHDLPRHLLLVVEADGDLVRALDDVEVGQDVPLLVDADARADARALPLPWRHLAEVLVEVVLDARRPWGRSAAGALAAQEVRGGDVDDRGPEMI